ncbi:hypothetical protein OHD47_28800, partial [Escherichia coli]|nr:hypothetical protein [Escherichia coli]
MKVVIRSNLKALKGRYEMVNIKLDKTGGLTEEALALATESACTRFSSDAGLHVGLPLGPLAP